MDRIQAAAACLRAAFQPKAEKCRQHHKSASLEQAIDHLEQVATLIKEDPRHRCEMQLTLDQLVEQMK